VIVDAVAPSLDRVLAYRNADVVDRFCDDWDVERAEAEALFDDMLRWLWLGTRTDGPLGITEPLLAIDEMWHTFVLFTVDYARFCEERIGRFIHHTPATRTERDADRELWRTDPATAQARWEARERAQYELVFRELGEATLLRWYVDLPTRFDEAFFRTARKPRSIRFRPTARLRQMREQARAELREDAGA
jgi:hypothetical protein